MVKEIRLYKEINGEINNNILLNFETLNDSISITNYQWQRKLGDSNWTDISISDNNTSDKIEYIISNDDIDYNLRCKITFTRLSTGNTEYIEYSPETDKVCSKEINTNEKIIMNEIPNIYLRLYSIGNPGVPINGTHLFVSTIDTQTNLGLNPENDEISYSWYSFNNINDAYNSNNGIEITGTTAPGIDVNDYNIYHTLSNLSNGQYVRLYATYKDINDNDINIYSDVIHIKNINNIFSYISGQSIINNKLTSYNYNYGSNIDITTKWQYANPVSNNDLTPNNWVDILDTDTTTYTLDNNLIDISYVRMQNELNQYVYYFNNYFDISGNLRETGSLKVSKKLNLPYLLTLDINNDNEWFYKSVRLIGNIYKMLDYELYDINNNYNLKVDKTFVISDKFIKFDNNNKSQDIFLIKSGFIPSYDNKVLIYEVETDNIYFKNHEPLRLNIYQPKIKILNDIPYFLYNKYDNKYYGINNSNVDINLMLIDLFNPIIHDINNNPINLSFNINNKEIPYNITSYILNQRYNISSIISNELDDINILDNKTVLIDISNNTSNNLIYKGNNVLDYNQIGIKIINISKDINNIELLPAENNRAIFITWEMPRIVIDNFYKDNSIYDGDIRVYVNRKNILEDKDYVISLRNMLPQPIIINDYGIDENAKYLYRDSIGIIPFQVYKYKIQIEYIWKKKVLGIEKILSYKTNISDENSVYVCFNNQFPYGRWTTNSNNPKLYGEYVCTENNRIKRDGNYNIIQSFKTGNIYGNVSNYLTKKEIFMFLSKFKGRVTR